MSQPYFVFEVAHPIHGQVKRVRVRPHLIYYVGGAAAVFALLAFGLLSSYLQMSWKASRYNDLHAKFEHLRTRYQQLQKDSVQHTEQMASLETLANEVSIAYGFNQPTSSSTEFTLASGEDLNPSVKGSLEEYNLLRSVSYSSSFHRYPFKWLAHTRPSLWPVLGTIRSGFGGRLDPFQGEGAFHTGVDLSAQVGTPVHASADGVVVSAGWSGHYGKLVIVDHGNGLRTYYAHLSQFRVVAGQEVRTGETVALSGSTGRVTGPHVHYEIRLAGTPVNPYKYLAKSLLAKQATPAHNDFGL